MLDILAILVALALLIYFAFRGISLLILAPILALLAALLTGGLPILAAYTQIFMSNVGQFIMAFFPLFLLGAIFGKLMDDSGCARSIARSVSGWLGPERAIVSVVLCCAVLTYGGVSAFVVAFAVFPIAAALFRSTNILSAPPRLRPRDWGLSPVVIMFLIGIAWLNHRAARARAAGEGYGQHVDSLPERDVVMREHSQSGGFDIGELPEQPPAEDNLPPFLMAVLPIVMVIAVNFAFVTAVVPRMDTSYLAEPLFGETTIESVRGVWAVIVALCFAILLLVIGNWRRLPNLMASLDKGADASVLPIFNTASLVGFGAVIAALPVFAMISQGVLAIGGGNALVSVAGSVATLSAITGSASGGMSIALEALGSTFVDMAQSTGVSLEAMHRVTAIASGVLDTLPHSGAIITLLAVCKLSHGEAYADIMAAAIVGPLISLIIIIALASLFGSF